MKLVKYEVTFRVMVDGGKLVDEIGTIGSSGTENDYNPNEVKDTITQLYRDKYPNVPIAVVINGKRKLNTEEEYQEAAKRFIRLNDREE